MGEIIDLRCASKMYERYAFLLLHTREYGHPYLVDNGLNSTAGQTALLPFSVDDRDASDAIRRRLNSRTLSVLSPPTMSLLFINLDDMLCV